MTRSHWRALSLVLSSLACGSAGAQTQQAPTAASPNPVSTIPASIFVAPAGGSAGAGRAVALDQPLPVECLAGCSNVKANAAAPTWVEGSTTNPASGDLHGALRFLPQTPAGVAIDLSTPSAIIGADGSTILSNANPAPISDAGGSLTVDGAVAPSAATSGGANSCVFEVAATDNHRNCKTSAGQVYSIHSFSTATAAMFIRLYDAGGSFAGCGSATGLAWEGQIPGPGLTGGGHVVIFPVGLAFTSGIAVCVTGAFGNTNTTNATAGVASVNIGYK